MNISNKIFFIILIYEFYFICYLNGSSTTSNKAGRSNKPLPKGVCRENKTITTPVDTWQIVQNRNVTKRTTVIGYKLINVCCPGYRKRENKCFPQCFPECEHGKCVAPNTCECDLGYKKLTNFKCSPDCPNCQNGNCLSQTECKCFSVYEKASNGSCVPRCDPRCENGDCLSPDKCTCHDGYEADEMERHVCNAICRVPCGIGGWCKAPDTCECNSGYRLNSTQQCEPICDNCDNGLCISPGECVCNDRYSGEACAPVCDPTCINGDCESPDTCTCREGYLKDQENPNICNPICTEQCGIRGRCIAPNQCECDLGYRLNATAQCEPICDSCDNGVCIKPGECLCNEKYEGKPCVPVCSPRCRNGHCTAPDVCTCDNGYAANEVDKHICKPVCRTSCGKGGRCIAPDTCECNKGYQLNITHQCEPVCDSCVNGVCIKPGVCICNKNYEGKPCMPKCDPLCINGDCLSPNFCKCHNGYAANPNEPNHCTPVCPVACGDGGRCIAPEICECYSGYRLNETQQCEPICENCENGECHSPGKCVCNENYESKQKYVGKTLVMQCAPICANPCQNGYCFDINECACNQGYEKDAILSHVCNRMCDPPCINGTCTQSNECECHSGYFTHLFKPNVCVDCKFTCAENEDCTIPEGCPCPENKKFNSEKQVCERVKPQPPPPCLKECVNGNCTYGTCSCYEGYDKLQDDSHICLPLCNNTIEGCVYGKCNAPDICTCFEDFQLSAESKFDCVPIVRITTPSAISSATPDFSTTTFSSPPPSSSTTEYAEKSNDVIIDGQLKQTNDDVECIEEDGCQSEMGQIKENVGPVQLLKAHLNYILLVVGIAIITIVIVLSMIYRKYNRTKTFKTHEQEAFLSSPYFIGGPIKTSCDIELE